MKEYEDALAEFNQFVEDVKKARDQYEELTEMYVIYKEIEELSLRINELETETDEVSESNRRLLQSEINVLQDNLNDKNNEFDERYDSTLDIEWPVMGEAYIKFMNDKGYSIRELNYIHEIVINDGEMPEKPVNEESETCAHCHNSTPVKGKTVCAKCSKELESFRNKNKKKDK